jgi:hypothetical protein
MQRVKIWRTQGWRYAKSDVSVALPPASAVIVLVARARRSIAWRHDRSGRPDPAAIFLFQEGAPGCLHEASLGEAKPLR